MYNKSLAYSTYEMCSHTLYQIRKCVSSDRIASEKCLPELS